MREIKFRAYDKEYNRMIFQHDMNIALENKEYLFSLNEEGVELLHYDKDYSAYVKCEAELMQYTGIYDKNGKEICVGDIVVLSEIIYNNCSKSEIEGAKSYIGKIVNYKGLCMCVKYKDKNGDTLYRPLYILEQDITSDDCSLAIIGNIYENEDLLEK